MGKKDSIISKEESELLHRANLTKRGLTLASDLEKESVIANIDKSQNEMSITLAPGVDMVFVRVPAGPFLMGTSENQASIIYPYLTFSNMRIEQPQHEVYLEEYWIAKYPVTNIQYTAFINANGKEPPFYFHDDTYPRGEANYPVYQTSWYDALVFCQWVSKSNNILLRLPTEAEWEKAARGTDERIYPWGSQHPNSSLCNFKLNTGRYDQQGIYIMDSGHTTRVGRYSPKGDSPYGCVDMAGNVWEWTSSLWGQFSLSPKYKYPYQPTDGRENLNAGDDVLRVQRGGTWYSDENDIRVSYRYKFYPNDARFSGGFRCACSL